MSKKKSFQPSAHINVSSSVSSGSEDEEGDDDAGYLAPSAEMEMKKGEASEKSPRRGSSGGAATSPQQIIALQQLRCFLFSFFVYCDDSSISFDRADSMVRLRSPLSWLA